MQLRREGSGWKQMGDNYIKSLKVDQKVFKVVLHNYIKHQDKENEVALFDCMLQNLCKIVMFRMGISEQHEIFDDIFNQCMYRCFVVINEHKYNINDPRDSAFAYFYSVIRNEILLELNKHHKYRKKEKCVDNFNIE